MLPVILPRQLSQVSSYLLGNKNTRSQHQCSITIPRSPVSQHGLLRWIVKAVVLNSTRSSVIGGSEYWILTRCPLPHRTRKLIKVAQLNLLKTWLKMGLPARNPTRRSETKSPGHRGLWGPYCRVYWPCSKNWATWTLRSKPSTIPTRRTNRTASQLRHLSRRGRRRSKLNRRTPEKLPPTLNRPKSRD
uniref:Uncharacterized protein n=1 Tax=Cacopsylla melanoneura TaxID=428564 RepID=A0A8D9F312_9HEMI